MKHTQDHERILERCITGELAEDAPEVAELLRECATCRAELAELRSAEERLEAVGALVRSDLAQDALAGPAAGEDVPALDVAAVLEKEWFAAAAAGLPTLSPPSSRSAERAEPEGPTGARQRWLWLAAAAALLATFLVYRMTTDSGLPPEILLGNELRCIEPSGTVESYGTFRWMPAVGSGGWYEVRVYDATVGGAGSEVARSPRLLEPRWNPDPAATDRWPEAIRWEVEAFEPSGSSVGSGRARASRSSPSGS